MSGGGINSRIVAVPAYSWRWSMAGRYSYRSNRGVGRSKRSMTERRPIAIAQKAVGTTDTIIAAAIAAA
jgi:hypothetical protein